MVGVKDANGLVSLNALRPASSLLADFKSCRKENSRRVIIRKCPGLRQGAPVACWMTRAAVARIRDDHVATPLKGASSSRLYARTLILFCNFLNTQTTLRPFQLESVRYFISQFFFYWQD